MIVFFEDEEHSHFYPPALTRPVDDLRIGILKIHEKWLLSLGVTDYTRTVRPFLKPVFGSPVLNAGEDVFWINARFLPGSGPADFTSLKPGTGLRYGNTPVVIRLTYEESLHRIEEPVHDFSDIPCDPAGSGYLLNRVWDLFQHNGREIEKDFERLGGANQSRYSRISNGIMANPGSVFMGEGVKTDPGVIIDATDGPVYIGHGAHLMAGAIVKGPAALCDGAILKIGAKIYPQTTIGPVCKVGGEVKNVIFQSYSNKAHDGYLGNSFIGEWCNLGADTNSSNLKNNYKPIYLLNWQSRKPYETGIDYCGTIMGDHCKTGINTMLGTGTMCGVSCNLFTNTYTPKYIPSFSWIGNGSTDVYRFDKSMETAELVMAHRDVNLSEGYRRMMKNIFDTREVAELEKT